MTHRRRQTRSAPPLTVSAETIQFKSMKSFKKQQPTVLICALAATAIASNLCTLRAADIGVWQDASSVTYFNDEITAAGQIAVNLPSLSAANLSGLEALILLNSSNVEYASSIINAAADLATFVSAGGELHIFDRNAGNSLSTLNAILPGDFYFNIVRDFSPNLDLAAPSNPYFTGLSNSSFDGGNSASHGYIPSNSLPAGATILLNVEGDSSKVVDFTYVFGEGTVHYSAIPADYYGSFNAPPFSGAVSTYVKNTAAAVPEPTSAVLAAFGACAIMLRSRKSRA